ncbi:C-type mannose receptor 2-like [Channa argus]|uniref:C-type mannose receptor 2-like n=1 Tax=Channa argus TaxID=215402 RepID=UPI0035223A88
MMKRILLVVLSLSGWSLSTCLLHQYHYVPDLKTWTEAQSYCRQRYTDLATIGNTEEMNQLINTVLSAGYNSQVWIGLYNEINWTWSDGYTGSDADFRNWETNIEKEPNFDLADQFCVSTGAHGTWFDDQCTFPICFFCYSGSQMNPDFVFVNKAMNWSSAQGYCREKFTDLVTVRNRAENLNIQNLMQSNYAWIGLFRDPSFYWSDQSIFSFTYLDQVANHIGLMNVTCGVADLQKSGRWRFQPCETRNPFVCYMSSPVKEAVKRQVVKLGMKLKDSSVDLNDPAVEANILKKLQDRLKENGVSEVTVKWREQPDGKVFQKGEDIFHKKNRKKTKL